MCTARFLVYFTVYIFLFSQLNYILYTGARCYCKWCLRQKGVPINRMDKTAGNLCSWEAMCLPWVIVLIIFFSHVHFWANRQLEKVSTFQDPLAVRDSSCDPLDPLSYARAHRRHFKISGAKRINRICIRTYPYIHVNVPTRVRNSGDGPCFLPLNIHGVLVHALQVTKRKDFDTGVQVCTLLCTE